MSTGAGLPLQRMPHSQPPRGPLSRCLAGPWGHGGTQGRAGGSGSWRQSSWAARFLCLPSLGQRAGFPPVPGLQRDPTKQPKAFQAVDEQSWRLRSGMTGSSAIPFWSSQHAMLDSCLHCLLRALSWTGPQPLYCGLSVLSYKTGTRL